MNYRQKRQDKIARQIQKEYTALAQLEHEKELGTICVQHGITKSDLFELIERKRGIGNDRCKSKGYTLQHKELAEVEIDRQKHR